MAFISRNPKNVLNPECAENFVSVEPKKLSAGQEFIGYFKNMYTDPTYNNKCYVFKSADDGKDYLFYGTKSLNDELVYYTQGDLVSITYGGQHENKKGPFAGKMSHVWKVSGESTWIPSPEFIAQLQSEVSQRRMEVQQLLANSKPILTQVSPSRIPSFNAVSVASTDFGNSTRKSSNPFG